MSVYSVPVTIGVDEKKNCGRNSKRCRASGGENYHQRSKK